MTACRAKIGYGSRLEAESSLARAIRNWKRDPTRAAWPPCRVYRCPACDRWHLTGRPDNVPTNVAPRDSA